MHVNCMSNEDINITPDGNNSTQVEGIHCSTNRDENITRELRLRENGGAREKNETKITNVLNSQQTIERADALNTCSPEENSQNRLVAMGTAPPPLVQNPPEPTDEKLSAPFVLEKNSHRTPSSHPVYHYTGTYLGPPSRRGTF